MNSTNLDDVVRSVITDFVKSDKLFTGLDVSNEVKNLLPLSRHAEISSLVRGMYPTDMEIAGYGRTPIDVVLKDGSKRTAMLYHPLSDSWDLDSKYDAQMRTQTAVKPTKTNNVGFGIAQASVVIAPSAASVAAPVPVVIAPVPAFDARAQWTNLFTSQPSLFPRR